MSIFSKKHFKSAIKILSVFIFIAVLSFLNFDPGYFQINKAQAAVTYQTPGAIAYSTAGGTSVSPAYPVSITAGDLLVLIIGMKPSTANGGSVTAPIGWTAIPSGSLTGAGGYGTTLGADTGNTNVFTFYKVAAGGETGSLAVTITDNNISWAQMYRFSAGVGSTWSVAGATGSDAIGGTSVSITHSANPGVTAGDYILGAMVIPTDRTTPNQFSAEALSQTGITFGTVTEISEPDRTTGNDIGGVTYRVPVSSGTASAAPTFTATAGGVTANVRGPGVFIRVRETVPPPAAPSVTTYDATNVSNTTATLNGSANPNSASTTGWFRYSDINPGSCNDTFGIRVPLTGGTALGSGVLPVAYSQDISGLAPSTTYYFCAIAENTIGKSYGSMFSFVTFLSAPILNESFTSATFPPTTCGGWTTGGNANWERDTVTFDTSPASAVAPASIGNNQSSWIDCNITLTSSSILTFKWKVSSEINYDYLLFCYDNDACTRTSGFDQRISGTVDWTTVTKPMTVGAHSLRWLYAKDVSLSVGSDVGWIDTVVITEVVLSAPSVVTSAATNISNTTATLNGSANPNSASTTGWFRYSDINPGSCNDTFGIRVPLTGGTALGSGVLPVAYSQDISGLAPSTTYYFCAIAENTIGKSYGSMFSFVTFLSAPVLNESFTSATFPPTTCGGWTTGGNASWARDTVTFDTFPASAVAPASITDNQSSWIDCNITLTSSSILTFRWKVSSELNYDYLLFCYDNDACTRTSGFDQRISGTVDWTTVTKPMTVGAHSLRWLYAKDVSLSVGSDVGWIDTIVIVEILPAVGDLTSVVFNTGVSDPAYNSIVWKGTLPFGTKVKFRIAASDISTGPWTDADFIGSDNVSCGSAFWYESQPDTPISLGCYINFNNKQYFKYKARLCSSSDCFTSGTQTPTVTDIIVNWSP